MDLICGTGMRSVSIPGHFVKLYLRDINRLLSEKEYQLLYFGAQGFPENEDHRAPNGKIIRN